MEERHKIQVFQRELPLCLELVTQLPKPKGFLVAIERCKQQISDATADYMHGKSKCYEQTSSEGHVFEEFIPLTRISYNSRCTTQRGNGRRIKLRAIVVEMKRNGVLFNLSKGEKSIGKTNGPVAKEPSSAPVTSSTTDTVSGGSGGNNKKEKKDGQGNKGKTGHRSCTTDSYMLFSSTTWWFTWAHFGLSHWAPKNSGPALTAGQASFVASNPISEGPHQGAQNSIKTGDSELKTSDCHATSLEASTSTAVS